MAAKGTIGGYVDSKAKTVSVSEGIIDRTSTKDMTDRARRILEGARTGAEAAGLSEIRITAARGGGHKSHSQGTEWDIKGYNADGSLWSNAQRIAVGDGARQAGADRFGIYRMTSGLGAGTLHLGYSGPGRPAAVWGANGLTNGPKSRQFTDPAEKAFYDAVSRGTAFASTTEPTPPADVSALGSTTLHRGSKGPRVEALQHVLSRAGLYDGRIDGDYGPATEKAVKAFQKAQNRLNEAAGIPTISVDGKVGNVTRPLIQSLSAQQSAALVPGPGGRLSDEYAGPLAPTVTPSAFDPAQMVADTAAAPIEATTAALSPDRSTGPLGSEPAPQAMPTVDDFLRSVMPDVAPGMVRQNAPSVTGNQISTRAQFPGGAPIEAARQSIRDQQGPLAINPADIGVDPRNLPVEAGRLSFERGPLTEADARQNAIQNLRGSLLAGSVSDAPRSYPVGNSAVGMGGPPNPDPEDQRRMTADFQGRGIRVPLPRGGSVPLAVGSTAGGISDTPRSVPTMPIRPSDPYSDDVTRAMDRSGGYGSATAADAPDSPLKQAVERAALQRRTAMQNLAGNEMAGSTAAPSTRSTAALRPLAARTVDYSPGFQPTQTQAFDIRDAADFAGLSTYRPTSPVAASGQPIDDIRPPQPELYTPAPQPQAPGMFGQLGTLMQNPIVRGGLGLLTGGPLGAAMGAGGALLGQMFRGGGLEGMFGGDPETAARSAAIAGGVSPSDRVGGNFGEASYGRKQSDGSVTGTTERGTGWSSAGGGKEVTVGGKKYRQNANGRGYARVL